MNLLSDQHIQTLAKQHSTPLMAIDCDQVRKQLLNLQQALPSVDFFYAVKALPHPAIINTLNQCGVGFDIASSGEIELLREQYINPRRSIHTHPIKSAAEIKSALRYGCTTFVVDNEHELLKFTAYRKRVGILLRISFRNADATVDLSKKFGCQPGEALSLLKQADNLGIHIKGLSFHVGSQCATPSMHVTAINTCADIIQSYNKQSKQLLSTIDIGGGFPVGYDGKPADIMQFCKPINDALARLPHELTVIAEPGRYLAAPAAIAISSVVGKSVRDEVPWYYLDDGVYGVYSGCIFDHAHYPMRSLRDGQCCRSVLAGPTCDSIDVIDDNISLPALEIGDLVVGEMIGAYSTATSTQFNLLPSTKTVVLNEISEPGLVAHIA